MLRHGPSVSVYGWGRGDLGQLGLGDDSNRRHPTLINNLEDKDILHVAANDFHTAFLTGDGELYTTGSNDLGQLGARGGDKPQCHFHPLRVAALDAYTVTHVACGQTHTVAVIDNGSLASWGASEFGQLGHEDVAGKVDAVLPRIVKGSRQLQFVRAACGSYHTLALTGSGDVYSFGFGAFGALGQGAKDDVTIPRLVDALWGLGIVQISCGDNHSAALSCDGQVFTWGRGKYGQLGHGSVDSEFRPVAVKALADQFVIQVVCGGDHTIAVNSEGEIFSWGRGYWGGTGLGTQEDVLIPQQILSLQAFRIVQVSAGARHSIALASNGKIFGWGDGEQGQLGIYTGTVQLLPVIISDDVAVGRKVCYVVAGGEHTMAAFQQRGANVSRVDSMDRKEEEVGDPMDISDPLDWEERQGETKLETREHELEVAFGLLEAEGGQDIHGAGLRRLELPSLMSILNVLKGTEISPGGLRSVSSHALEHVFASVRFMILSFKERQRPKIATGAKVVGEEREAPGLDIDLIREVYQGILELYNPEVVKRIGTAMVRMLDGLEKHMDHASESRWLRVLLIILQSPLIGEKGVGETVSTRLFSVYMRISSSSEKKVVEWLRTYPRDIFAGRFVRGVQKYITNRIQVLGGPGSMPKDIVAAIKVLSSLHEANAKENFVSYSEFHSHAISDSLKVEEEYEKWTKEKGKTRPLVSYCQVPFILTPDAKSKILQSEALLLKRQLVHTSVFQQLIGNTYTSPFLVLNIRRSRLIHDTLQQLAHSPTYDLRKPLKVIFEGEAGIDEGGVTKEFFQLLVRDLFNVTYGMFTYNEESRTIWFNLISIETESEFRLVGLVLGLAIYNGVILDIHFPMLDVHRKAGQGDFPTFKLQVVYKKITHAELNLEDLKDLQPQLWRGFHQLLDFHGDVASTFSLTFQVEYEYFGEIRTHDLEPGGANIVVNNDNRRRYVDLYVNYLLEDSIRKHYTSFYKGFMEVCAGQALTLFRHEELELLICGLPHFDFDALERVTVYQGGYTKENKVIRWFWELVRAMPLSEKKQLLFFVTGNDRAPIGGLGDLKFIVQKNGDDTDRLPTAHTCFNVFMLPEYSSKLKLDSRLKIAIQNSTGFGLQ